jgi:uncharacterized membrane protein
MDRRAGAGQAATDPTRGSAAEPPAASAASAPSAPQASAAGASTGRPFAQRLGAVLARLRDRYPTLPPAPRYNRVGLVAVGLLALAFVIYFVAFTWAKHDAYQTFAEDMGIMDQSLWNLVHGYGLRQTICNPISDTNCLGDVSRLAIHFEPIMYVFGLFYLVAPSPKTLQLVQALVVASGALPAYWIASRRLRSVLAGIGIAAVYLLYPALQNAVTYDFHAVTLAAAFLMFALYFMLTRNTVGLVVACVLALATKENIPADIFLIGASIIVLQRRPRIGLALCALSLGWLAVELPIMHAASPLGRSSTADRYAYMGSSPLEVAAYLLTHPLQVVREHVLDAGGIYYLRSLLSPSAYLALLSPLTLLVAVPAIAINLLSSSASQRSGLYHYNAEIVPILILASVESVAWLAGLAAWVSRRGQRVLASTPAAVDAGARLRASAVVAAAPLTAARAWLRTRLTLDLPAPNLARATSAGGVRYGAVLGLVAVTLVFSLHEQAGHGYLPFSRGFAWPQQSAHTRLADDVIRLIPAGASLSAQSDLAPHVSQRRFIYQYPFGAESAQYVLLDLTGNIYPFNTAADYFASVRALLGSHTMHVVAARDGYLLLARGAGPSLNPADPYGLPESLYSFSDLPASTSIPHPLSARMGSGLELLGYDIAPTTRPSASSFISVTTYWRVSAPVSGIALPQLLLTRPDGTFFGVGTFAATALRPLNAWQPGTIYALRADVYVTGREIGRDTLGVRLQSGPGQTPADFLDAALMTPPGAGGLPHLDPDRKQVIFAAITVV